MTTAKQRYEVLSTTRDPFLRRARDCAKITIPALMPPSGHSGSSTLPTPWQGIGARCVNSLASRLFLALFPPATSFFKLTIDDFALEQLTKSKGQRGAAETALAKIERATINEMETSNFRPALHEALKHLIATGNYLLYLPPTGGPRGFRLDRYVVKRDPVGNLLELVTHEPISPLEAPAGFAPTPQGGANKRTGDDTLDLYTHATRTRAGWEVYQEINGKRVPNTGGTYTEESFPFRALRYTAVDGEDYGRGLVEEYLGDFRSLEALTKAITQGAAAAAKVLFLVNPNGSTKKKTIAEAESGAVREGIADDVTVLQLDKYGDFRVALELRNNITDQLAYAFLLNSAIQRAGERVTAEEVRYMAQELEAGLGGIYSNLSQELQLPIVVLLMDRLQRQKRLPALPKELVKPAVTTGLDAIGRGADRNRLTSFIGTLKDLDPRILDTVNEAELSKRLAAADGIDPDGLIKSAEEVAQERQRQQMQAMAEKLGPNVINAAAKQGAA
jgi:hypothetical protein